MELCEEEMFAVCEYGISGSIILNATCEGILQLLIMGPSSIVN